jgi:hypothetical protein
MPVKASGKKPAIAETLARGRQAAEDLDKVTNELTETLEGVERALSELRLGVNASVELEPWERVADDPSAPEYGTLLGFQREGKLWRLVVLEGEVGDPDSWKSQPLINASRSRRLLAVKVLPALIERLVAQAVAQRDEIVSATQATRAILDDVRQAAGQRREP